MTEEDARQHAFEEYKFWKLQDIEIAMKLMYAVTPVRALLRDIIRADPMAGWHLLDAVQEDLNSLLEEENITKGTNVAS